MFQQVYWVMDDVTLEISKRGQSSGQMSPMESMFPMCAGLGINLWYADHCPGLESPVIRQNTAGHIFVGATENSWLIKEMLRLTDEHFEKVVVLAPGEIVAFIPATWPLAVYGEFFDVPEGRFAERERLIRKARFYRSVKAMKPEQAEARPGGAKKGAKGREGEAGTQRKDQRQGGVEFLVFGGARRSKEELPGGDKGVLVILATEWGISSTVMYKRAGLSPRKGIQAVKRLEAKGLIRVHTFSGAGRGGRYRIVEVTDEGWEILEGLGVERAKALTQGGWEHELAARLIGRAGKRRGYQVEYEVSMFERRFDVVWTSKEGQKTFFEVELSDISHAVDNVLKAMEIPGVSMFMNRIVLVVRDKKDADRAAKLLAKRGYRVEESNEISIRTISDFINI